MAQASAAVQQFPAIGRQLVLRDTGSERFLFALGELVAMQVDSFRIPSPSESGVARIVELAFASDLKVGHERRHDRNREDALV